MSLPLEALDPSDATITNKRPRKISGHANFLKLAFVSEGCLFVL